MDIRFLGHACFELTEGDARVLVDPFLTGNPKAGARQWAPAHPHLPDARPFGPLRRHRRHRQAHRRPGGGDRRGGGRAGGAGPRDVADPNIGGTIEFEGGWVRLTPAWHTATTPNGRSTRPAGLVINLGGKTVTTWATPPCSPTSGSPGSATSSMRRSCASAGTTRWTATTRPWRASDRRAPL